MSHCLILGVKSLIESSPRANKSSSFSETLASYTDGTANRDQVVTAAMEHFRSNGVRIEIEASKTYKGHETLPGAPYLTKLIIRPSSDPAAHPLNSLAYALKRDAGISLVYDFNYMLKLKFNGAFAPGPSKTIYVSNEFVHRLGADGTYVHELEHAYLQFLREAGEQDNVFNTVLRAPSSDASVIGYEGYVPLEEMLNHPLSIRIAAWELVRAAKTNPSLFDQKLIDFKNRIQAAKKVVRIVKDELPSNIESLEKTVTKIHLPDTDDRLIVTASPSRVNSRHATVMILNKALALRFRTDPGSARVQATDLALRRLQSLNELAIEQDESIERLSTLAKSAANLADARKLESASRDLLRRALSELKNTKSAKPKAVAASLGTSSLMDRQRSKFESLLKTSGFASLEDLQKAVDDVATTDMRIWGARNAIRGNDVEIAMYRKSSSRQLILKDGFLNSHQSGRSGGDKNIERRRVAEASYLGMSLSEYMLLSDSQKPKYLFLRFPWEERADSSTYGDDLYIFGAKHLEDQLTFTLGDSLDKSPQISESAEQTGWKAKSWDHLFVPWRYRELMIPELLPGYFQSHSLMVPINSGLSHLHAFYEKEGFDAFLKYRKSLSANQASYVEGQFFDSLGFKDLEGFQFNKNPPSGDFLRALLDRGIPIYDGRSGTRVRWTPSENETARLLQQKDAISQAAPKYTSKQLSSTMATDDRIKLKWRQGTETKSGLGWVKRIYSKNGKDYLEITQAYRGDEYIDVSIAIEDIVDFKNISAGPSR